MTNMKIGLILGIFWMCVLMRATNCVAQIDTAKVIEFHDFDEAAEFEATEWGLNREQTRQWRHRYDSCAADRQWQDSIRYAYFIENVYLPAIQRTGLPAENKRFLDRLKSYLECPTDSCGLADKLMRPVYPIPGDSLYTEHRIVANFPWAESDNSYDGSGWGDDTIIPPRERTASYRIVYANAPVAKRATIHKYYTIAAPCLFYKSYLLRQVPETDTLQPAFCTTFDLALEWVQDTEMDSLLIRNCSCENTFRRHCDSQSPMVTFARLKGVPLLYFTIYQERYFYDTWYPTRGLFMNYGGKIAVELWKHQMEMVGCSCI